MLCMGHRGAKGHEPENTLSSIRKALELGAAWVEVDVRLVDGRLLVFHDDRLERTTNGKGAFHRHTFDQLRTLDAGGGQRIPTLEEVCGVLEGRGGLNVELKEPGTAAPVAALIASLVDRGWSRDAFLVSSFNHRELVEMKRLDADVRTGALICGLPLDDARFAEDLGAFSVHPSLEFIDGRFVDDAHARGLRVYVYTVDHPEDIEAMHRIGVDGIITNYPERVLPGGARNAPPEHGDAPARQREKP